MVYQKHLCKFKFTCAFFTHLACTYKYSTLPHGVTGLRPDVATFIAEKLEQTQANQSRNPAGEQFSRAHTASLGTSQRENIEFDFAGTLFQR